MEDFKLLNKKIESLFGDYWKFIKYIVDTDVMARVIWDYEGHFVYANKKFCNLLGYDLEELQEKAFLSLVHEEDLERTVAEYSTIKDNELQKVGCFCNRYLQKGGGHIWIDWKKGFYSPSLQLGSGQVVEATPERLLECYEDIDKFNKLTKTKND